MNAIVCDKCGKVMLMEDDEMLRRPTGSYRLIKDTGKYSVVDLCEDCANEIVEAVRRTKGGE